MSTTISNEWNICLLFLGDRCFKPLYTFKGGSREACSKRLQKQVSKFIVTKHNMTNRILSAVLD